MTEDEFKSLKFIDHFAEKCAERAPWFVREKKEKDGGGFNLEYKRLYNALIQSIEIERFKTITRLIKYGDKTKYYHFKNTKLKKQVIFVVEENVLKTLYLYKYSWAAKI